MSTCIRLVGTGECYAGIGSLKGLSDGYCAKVMPYGTLEKGMKDNVKDLQLKSAKIVWSKVASGEILYDYVL